MGRKSREKGKRGERELAAFFRERGIMAKRGQQHSGSPDSPDVMAQVDGLHIECKRTEALSLYTAMEQAEADCGFNMPVVFHRRNGKPWLAILSANEFITLLKEAGRC